ncbi:MAG: formyltransferase family protein, partial [Parabacteroides sp.]|nr:formyltransferase family protein [Parabacteroides sp.]
MKIGYFADGPWSHYALDKIIKDPQLEIVFIVARYPQPDEKLRLYSEQLKVPFLVDSNVNSIAFINIIKGYAPDINVSMSFNQIMKEDILDVAPLGFINCHAGQLPFYRGRNILNWALINGESHFGVTVHYIDIGIDTGDIILQRLEPIENTDDYQSLLKKAYRLCGETLYDALLMLQKGETQVIKQRSIHPVGFYCGRRITGDEYIDWNWNSQLIYNFVRAIVPPAPGARTFLNDSEIVILKTELID